MASIVYAGVIFHGLPPHTQPHGGLRAVFIRMVRKEHTHKSADIIEWTWPGVGMLESLSEQVKDKCISL